MTNYLGAIALWMGSLAAVAQQAGNFPTASDVQKDFSGKVILLTPAKGQAVEENQAVTYLKSLINTPGLDLRLLRRETDRLGMVHLRYEVLFDGNLIANKSVSAHFKNGLLQSVSGDIQHTAAPDGNFTISEQAALQAAITKVGAEKYKWQNEAETHHMRQALNDTIFSYYPTGQKVWLEKEGVLHATWKFNIYAEAPLYRANVFVDAASGAVLFEQNLICTGDVPGTAVTKYSGTQSMTVNQPTTTLQLYRLRQSTYGLGVETYNLQNGNNYGAAKDFTNATPNWTITTADQGATDAHWGAERTYDYYFTQHSRNSIDNNGMKLLSYVHYQTNYNNAFWDGQRMTYGDGNANFGTRIFCALDVCGHEITHGLTDLTSGLIYQNQSGALNEAFSDIFGACIENFARPSNWNWKIGEDLTIGGGGLRNMASPNSDGNPDTYLGTYWYSGTADNGGVHTNSGVPNYWFYLLVTGGSGINDISNTFNIQGIGMQKAANIAFRALTLYFNQSTDFAAARAGCIQAAKDLYGDCSNEMIQTANAWHAVGVGGKILSTVSPNFVGNAINFCSVPATVTFSNTTPYAQTYSWDFGDGAKSTAMNPMHTFTTAGNYTIKLKATGCNSVDSISKVAYVIVDVPTAPVVSGVSSCYGTPGVLFASANGLLRWYDSPVPSNSLQTGTTLNVPTVTANTTYYVNNTFTSTPAFGGIPMTGGGGYISSPAQFLRFDVLQNSVLNTVVMYAQTAGTRTIELRNGAFNLLATQAVQLNSGANTVTLDFNLSPGQNYMLGLTSMSSGNLYRTNNGVLYPYNIGGCITITGSSAGTAAYYWFYNWQVTRADCVSPMSAATVTMIPAPQVQLNVPSEILCVEDVVPVITTPPGGTLTGTGIQGSDFSAYFYGQGTYTIDYVYQDINGCENSAQVVMTAQECTGVGENSRGRFGVYPNPASTSVALTGVPEGALVTMHDSNGRLVMQLKGAQAGGINVSELAKGLYLISLTENGRTLGSFRLVKD